MFFALSTNDLKRISAQPRQNKTLFLQKYLLKSLQTIQLVLLSKVIQPLPILLHHGLIHTVLFKVKLYSQFLQ